MAIYHLEAKVVSRGTGRSAVAAAAYLSCTNILNDYDGVRHDFTRKKGLVWREIFLTEYAPLEWQDRCLLWNAAEENEKTKDSRLAREFVAALPIELRKEQWQQLLTDFIQNSFIADGMCADVAIHDPNPPGHNPHAHIMLTVRPLDEQGKWQYKTEKEYLCVKNGEEKGFTAAEFRAAQTDGWEKQYQYKVGKKKIYMPRSEAEAKGYERVSKYPKSTKFGRQNPISERWNSDEQLVLWRKAWADTTNRFLARAGLDETIDHRSHAERGIDEQPTVHEGVIARALENKGIVSDCCELNRQIKADNALLRELNAQVKKLMQAVKNTIPAIAEAMENVRQNVIIFCYQLGHIRTGQKQIKDYLSSAQSEMAWYTGLAGQIKEKSRERKALLAEQKDLPFWNVPKKKELTARIAELTELLEELRSEKAMALQHLRCADDSGIPTIKKDIAATETSLKKLDQQEAKYAAELDAALKQYAEMKEQAAELEPLDLHKARQTIRPDKEQSVVRRVQSAYGDKYSPLIMYDSKREVSKLLNEYAEDRAMQKLKREQQRKIQREQQPQPRKKKIRDDWER
jgi:hypothetical protein